MWNRIDCSSGKEWHGGAAASDGDTNNGGGGYNSCRDLNCKQYISTSVLRDIFRLLEDEGTRTGVRVNVLYVRINHADTRLSGLSREKGQDGGYSDLRSVLAMHARVCPRGGCEGPFVNMGKPIGDIDDERMISAEFPHVRVLLDEYFSYAQAQQLHALRDGGSNAPSPAVLPFNEYLLRALSDGASFVSIQGGGSYIASYFGGCNEVADMYGDITKKPKSEGLFVPPCVAAAVAAAVGEAHSNVSGGGGGSGSSGGSGGVIAGAAAQRRASGNANTVVATAAVTSLAKANEQEQAEERTRSRLRPRARRQQRRRRRLSDTARPALRRRLVEKPDTYEDVLPRLSGARVTKHYMASSLLEAVRGWFSDPQCGLINTALPPKNASRA